MAAPRRSIIGITGVNNKAPTPNTVRTPANINNDLPIPAKLILLKANKVGVNKPIPAANITIAADAAISLTGLTTDAKIPKDAKDPAIPAKPTKIPSDEIVLSIFRAPEIARRPTDITTKAAPIANALAPGISLTVAVNNPNTIANENKP